MCRPSFSQSVDQTFDTGACKPGLQAIKREHRCSKKRNRGCITAQDPRKILGSVDIDGRYAAQEPHAPRWDYVIGYYSSPTPRAYFVEVHPAGLEEIEKIRSKWGWLMEKLKGSPFLNPTWWKVSYHWLVPGEGDIPFTKGQIARMLAEVPVMFEGRGPLRLTG